MNIRSLGLISDLMLMEDVAEVIDQEDHLVIRTPSEPNFWWGNYVMFQECPDDPSAQVAAFKAAFPDAKHQLIVWDNPTMAVGAGHKVLTDQGFEIEAADVLTLTVPLVRGRTPKGIDIRPIVLDADWLALVELQNLTGIAEGHDAATHRPFIETRFATIRGQVEAGRSRWFGAFDGPLLVGDLGIMFDANVARYRMVETRESHRRRGICAALLAVAHDWAMQHSPQAVPVIVAMADSDAGRIYRRCGFERTETGINAVKKGY